MKKKFFNAKIYRNETATEIIVENGEITQIGTNLPACEEEIDLNAVAQEIRDLERKVAEIDKTIAGFCKELGIDKPFVLAEGDK